MRPADLLKANLCLWIPYTLVVYARRQSNEYAGESNLRTTKNTLQQNLIQMMDTAEILTIHVRALNSTLRSHFGSTLTASPGFG